MKDHLARHKIIALDTSIFIYHLEGHPTYSGLTARILGHIQSGKSRGIASELSLHEIIVRPLKLQLPDVADEYELLLSNFPNLLLSPVSREILVKAAELRAMHGFRTPDAIIVATAIENRATLMITNDKRWKRLNEPQIACLDDFM